MTLQKGPEYFLYAAKKVLEYEPHTMFLMIGSGDMLDKMMTLANELEISNNVLFHGKYTRDEANEFFSRADVFVMPSVSEPFGIVPLEAVSKGTPTIISNQSGISEVLVNSLKVDFWDTDNMAHKIISLLRYNDLYEQMRHLAFDELKYFNWSRPANSFKDLYVKLL
jgi:glycosyltransferase involved in cell wall biosynthesis